MTECPPARSRYSPMTSGTLVKSSLWRSYRLSHVMNTFNPLLMDVAIPSSSSWLARRRTGNSVPVSMPSSRSDDASALFQSLKV